MIIFKILFFINILNSKIAENSKKLIKKQIQNKITTVKQNLFFKNKKTLDAKNEKKNQNKYLKN